jgi:hypothetical protein
MVRLPLDDNSQPFSGATFPQFAVGFIAISVTLVLIARLFASTTVPSTDPHTTESQALSRLADWVHRTGKATVMRGNIAEQFSLPASDIPVLERGLRTQGEQFTHVCSIGRSSTLDHLLFLASVDESDGHAIVWRAAKNGELLATVEFRDGIARNVPNADFAADFARELNYFIAKAASP